MPAQQENVAGQSIENRQPATGLAPAASALDTVDNLAEVREAIVQGAADDVRQSNRDAATGTAQLDDGDPQSLPDRIEVAEEGMGEPGMAGADQDGGTAPGDAKRRLAEDGPEQPEAAREFREVMASSIERFGSRVAGSRATGGAFSDTPDGLELNIVPVPAPPAASSWTSLSEAELAYASRYLALKDHDNE